MIPDPRLGPPRPDTFGEDLFDNPFRGPNPFTRPWTRRLSIAAACVVTAVILGAIYLLLGPVVWAVTSALCVAVALAETLHRRSLR